MIFHPLIIALLGASLLICFLVLYATAFGSQILQRWDLRSGSELQLRLERKTYLISTLLAYLFSLQILSLFLFVFTADRLHTFFIGAMCAAGTLNVNSFGYTTLLFKIVNFLLAGLWLILNAVDNRGADYPLIRKKYAVLLGIAPLVLAESVFQAIYFLSLKPDITTSCCSTLFDFSRGTLVSSLAALPAVPMKAVFFASTILTAAAGVFFMVRKRGAAVFAALSGSHIVVSILSILSFISVYFYELPTHHCPFCILQKGYGYIGYPIYFAVLGGGLCGMAVGVLALFRKIPSLAAVVPSVQRKLALAALIGLAVFAAITIHRLIVSNLILR